jgi:ketosteroid isomerase-like protein
MNYFKLLIMRKIYVTFILLVIISAVCCKEKAALSGPEYDKEKQLVEKTIHSCIGWAGKKDLELLHSVIANDPDFLEVDPENRVVRGFEDFRKAEKMWMSPDFQAVRYEIRDLTISISQSGDVAWWFCMLDDINTWQGNPASWMNTRWTGVLEKRKGKWIIVQQHFSFAVE